MPKIKYKYNPQTLNYEPIQRSWFKLMIRYLFVFSPGIVLGIIVTWFFVGSQSQLQNSTTLAQANRMQLEQLRKELQLTQAALNEIRLRDEELYRVSLYAEQMPDELKQNISENTSSVENYVDLSNEELMKMLKIELFRLEKQLVKQSKSFSDLIKIAKQKDKMLQCIPAIQPIHQIELKQLASGFGFRIDPIYKTQRMHTGMDFTAAIGTPIYVTGDGVVELVESEEWDYGKSIVVNHGFGYKTRYAHLNGFAVRKGQHLKRGELIGYVGNTGKSTGPHLHYEVEKNGQKVNPIHYYHADLSPREYQRLLDMSSNSFRVFD